MQNISKNTEIDLRDHVAKTIWGFGIDWEICQHITDELFQTYNIELEED